MSQESYAQLLASLSSQSDLEPELLNALPAVPTFANVSLIPMQQLVNLPLVHPLLDAIRRSVLKGKQRLLLHIGIGDQKWIKKRRFDSALRLPFASHLVDSTGALRYLETDTLFDTLHISTLNGEIVEYLTALMPGIVHLQVFLSGACISVLQRLALLLTNWATSLQELEVNIGPFYSPRTWREGPPSQLVSSLRALIQEISCKLGALQTLRLDIGSALDQHFDVFLEENQTGFPLNLTILGQLRQFYLDLGNCTGAQAFLLEQLEEYATETLTHIGLGGIMDQNWNQVANSQFAGQFTIVPFNYSPTSNSTIVPSFSSLTVYGFDCKSLETREVITHLRLLSSLSHLQCLKMHAFSPIPHPLPAPFTDLPSLTSVTVLEISISLEANEGHNNLQAPYWETLFPSVQIVKVNHLENFCALCYPDEKRNVITNYASVTPCLRQLFAPLADLPSLRKIFYQRERDIQCYLIYEFTPQGDYVRTHEDLC